MPKIVFICTANQFRSPIAAAYFLNKLQTENTPGDWEVSSAGTWTENGLPANPSAIELGEELHLKLGSHKTREINTEILSGADLVFVMEQGHKEALCFEFPQWCGKIILLSQVTDKHAGDIADPASNNFEDTHLIANIIIDIIDTKFSKITALSITKAEMNHNAQEKNSRLLISQ